jgi:hypothetical protein
MINGANATIVSDMKRAVSFYPTLLGICRLLFWA